MASESLTVLILQITQLCLIACCLLLVSSWLASATYLAYRKYIMLINAQIKNKGLIFYAVSALCASTVVAIWLSSPNSPQLPFVLQHCHNNNCTSHIPAAIDFTLLYLLFAFFSIGVLTLCYLLLNTHKRKLEDHVNSLLLLSQEQHNMHNVDSSTSIITVPQPIFINVGLLTPKILLSSQIAETLAAGDIKLLLAYEYAKAQQFENLKVKLVQLACSFWPRFIRQLLLADLRTVLQECAYQKVKQGLGNQQSNIPQSIRCMLPQNTSDFLNKISDIAQQTDDVYKSYRSTFFFTVPAYLGNLLYFICLVIITSNLSHFIFELIG